MGGLQRFRGHFYNWYDTRDLRPLDPRYVSTVDSGNLAGHLIALANACREWRGRAPAARQRLDGIADALEIARAETVRLRDGGQTQTVTLHQLDDALAVVALALRQARASSDDLAARLAGLRADAEIMVDVAGAFAIERGDGSGADMLFWAQATLNTIDAHRHDLEQSGERSALRERAALGSRRRQRGRWRSRWTSASCSNRRRQLLSIGFLVTEGALDPNCYDLLASEARLASFFAIAKGDVAAKHWFRLGRAATPVANGAALISWSGSMFEYLMPSLVMRAPAGSLLEQTNRLIVRRQIDLRRQARPALGHIGIGLQRSRPRVYLSILELRRSWPWVEARPRRRSGDRALRDRAGGDGRSARRRSQSGAFGRDRRARSLRLLRGAGLHADLACRRAKASRSCRTSWRIIRA